MGSSQETQGDVQDRAGEVPDGTLARRVQQGDREAFELLARRYLRPVHAVAASYLRERADVEDAAQDTFLRVLESIPSFDPSRPFAPWIYQIARNVARNRLRWRRRHPVSSLTAGVAPTARDAAPAAAAESAELREILADAIGALPEQRRTAFRMVDVEGYSAAEAARLMGLTPGAVRAHLYHARHRLRERLAPLLRGETEDNPRNTR